MITEQDRDEFNARVADCMGEEWAKNQGYLVETKTGLAGRVYFNEDRVNGKDVVHVTIDDKPVRLLCDPSTLKLRGFIN